MKYTFVILYATMTLSIFSMETNIATKQEEEKKEQEEEPVFTVPPMRVLIPHFAEKGYIQWEKDPERPNFQRIDLSFLLQNLCKDKPLTEQQIDFLVRFKKMSLPCPITKKDMVIIEQLSFEPFFALTVDKNAKIKHMLHYNPALGFKAIPKDSN